ncbi:MAG: hypothetical protein ACK4MV_12040 [Beijerinckiaceae bacterium]
MSSPDRASAKRATTKTKAAKAASPAKAAKKGAVPASVRKAAAKEPSPQEKADFVRAMSKGITPNTDAARKVEAKKKAAPRTEAAPQVEVLRRIPAPAAVTSSPESTEALRIAASIEKMLADGDLDRLQPHAQQALIAALCKYYAANTDAGNRYPVLGQRSAVTATDVMVMCGALLKAVDLQVFELGMWQSWSNS